MKKNNKFIILLLGFVVLLIAASVGYNYLSKQYKPDGVPPIMDGTSADTNSTPSDSDAESTDSSKKEESAIVPDFTVYDLNGNELTLYEQLGKPIVINFWATWCGPCQSEMPAFDKMYQEYGEQVTFLMINVTDGSRDTVENVTKFYEDSGYTFPIYLDTTLEASMTYGAYSIPVTFFLDSKGNLLYNQRGAMSEEVLKQCMDLLVQTNTQDE